MVSLLYRCCPSMDIRGTSCVYVNTVSLLFLCLPVAATLKT
jgi:hypothetical protein